MDIARAERRQREHELNGALEAARLLQARLELLADRAADVAVVRSLRDSLARDMDRIDEHIVDGTSARSGSPS